MRKMKEKKIIEIHPVTIDRETAKLRYGLGDTVLSKIAHEIGALVKVGRRKLYLTSKMDTYFQNLSDQEGGLKDGL